MTAEPSVNTRRLMMPSTCGRISAVSSALVRPATSTMIGTACFFSVSTPTSTTGWPAPGIWPLAEAVSLPPEQPARPAARRIRGARTDRIVFIVELRMS